MILDIYLYILNNKTVFYSLYIFRAFVSYTLKSDINKNSDNNVKDNHKDNHYSALER